MEALSFEVLGGERLTGGLGSQQMPGDGQGRYERMRSIIERAKSK
jgi:hypothetical protein